MGFSAESSILNPQSSKQGQAMLLTVLALGGTILGATTIAGLLTIYQIRQTTDLGNSAKAFFAADTGIEWGLYQFFKPGGSSPSPVFSNGASFETVCTNAAGAENPCAASSTTRIRSVGTSSNTSRALALQLTP